MAQDLTSVQWANPQNNLTDPQKEQARTNIGAGQTTVTTFHSSTHGQSYETPLEKITIYSDGLVMSNGGQVLAGAPVPQQEDEGKVLVAHVNGANQGVAEWKEVDLPEGSEKWELLRSQSGPNPDTIIATQFMSSTDEDVDEFFGVIGLQTTNANSGNFSLVPCDKDGHYLSSLGSQCINIGPLPDTKVHHFGFYFKSSTTDKIRYIGVKGDSASQNVNITQLLVQKK